MRRKRRKRNEIGKSGGRRRGKGRKGFRVDFGESGIEIGGKEEEE